MKLLRLVLAATFALALAAPAAAQRYTAKQDGDVIELADTTAQMNVSVVWSMSNAWRIQVKGKDLVRTSATLADFQARPGLNGMPLLAPFANRLDETAFYANGKKYNFDLELGNVRGPIPGHRLRQRHQGVAARRVQGRREERVGDLQAGFLQEPAVHEAVPVRAHDHDDLPRVGRRARSAHAARQPEQRADAGRDRLSPDLRAARRQPQRLDGVGRREDALDRDPAAAPDRRDAADRELLRLGPDGDSAQEVRADRRRVHRPRARRERPRDDEAHVQRQGAARDPRAEVQDRADVVHAARRWAAAVAAVARVAAVAGPGCAGGWRRPSRRRGTGAVRPVPR